MVRRHTPIKDSAFSFFFQAKDKKKLGRRHRDGTYRLSTDLGGNNGRMRHKSRRWPAGRSSWGHNGGRRKKTANAARKKTNKQTSQQTNKRTIPIQTQVAADCEGLSGSALQRLKRLKKLETVVEDSPAIDGVRGTTRKAIDRHGDGPLLSSSSSLSFSFDCCPCVFAHLPPFLLSISERFEAPPSAASFKRTLPLSSRDDRIADNGFPSTRRAPE